MPQTLERIDCADLFADPRNFAMRVSGDKHAGDEGIIDGDCVIVRMGDSAEQGELYLAQSPTSEEQTLRRWTPTDAGEFEILGTVVGLLRRY